ncbi:hypothetical protein [Actinoplanes utahensis]|uniref:hypothetical protein n=1 Tax=Actinoplanes utahensis TaxID=1869 RepID=UPI00126A7901|nr:hypothetical protein [Actinoplanes utahensis]
MTHRIAAGWAAAYGLLALGWTITGRGFPFGTGDSRNADSVLRALDPAVGAPVFAVVLLAAAAVLFAAGSGVPARPALVGYLFLVAFALLALVADVRLLTLAGYLPILVIGFPFGWPPVDYGTIFTWALANQVCAVAGGLLIARAAIRWRRRTTGACEACGRSAATAGWATPEGAARWGRAVTWIAAIIPALYAATRVAWLAGIPLGITEEFLAEMRRTGMVWAGAGLGSFALVGTILTLGLIQRWGERFPRWIPFARGRRVPIRLATIPASIVAVFVWSASISLFTGEGAGALYDGSGLASRIPMMLWPVWSITLGLAAYAYHLRRRPACGTCHRPENQPLPGLVTGAGPGAY